MNLFARTFAAFLLTILLGVLGFAFFAIFLQADRPVQRWQRLGDTVSLCASEASVQNPEAFSRFLARTSKSTNLKIEIESAAESSRTVGRDYLRLGETRSVIGSSGEPKLLHGEIPGGLWANLSQPLLRLLLIPLAVAMVCYALARTVSAPTLTLRSAAHRVASGDFAVRVSEAKTFRGRRDELGELAKDFDAMTVRLEAGRDAHRQLLADISHELRSPLARLSVALELARRKSAPGAAPAMDRIEREAERMNELVGELLALTRLEFPTAALPAEAVDLVELASEIALDADFEAQARRCCVVVRSPEERLSVSGERELLRRALENVVRNAVRFTAEGTAVDLEILADEKIATVRVRDHGPGVPEEALSQLFLPFWRVGTDRDRLNGGFGLGLAIAERAVRLHGGTIRAQNAEGGGLEITVTLLR